jgi:hypothetical protein
MAEIPVEKTPRSPLPWWAWLVGALALAGVLAVVFGRSPEPPSVDPATPVAMPEPAPVPSGLAVVPTAMALDGGGAVVGTTVVPTATPVSDGAVTQVATSDGGAFVSDVELYGATADKRTLLDRRVEFSNVRVTRVVSDRVFTVTSGGGELYAMLDDALNQGAMEQRVNIVAGQLLDVQGAFRAPPNAETANEQRRPVGLTPAVAASLRAQPLYLHVTLVRGSAVH